MRQDTILRVVTKLLLPFVLMFAFFVQMHADFSPGGGFQAGVIVAAAVILYAIIWGLDAARRVAPPALVVRLVPAGALFYAAVGLVSIPLGGKFLDYDVLASPAYKGQHWGIFLVELGVLVTVAATMLAIFYAFAGRGRR